MVMVSQCPVNSTLQYITVQYSTVQYSIVQWTVNSEQWRDAEQLVQPSHQAAAELGNTGSCRASNKLSRSMKLYPNGAFSFLKVATIDYTTSNLAQIDLKL